MFVFSVLLPYSHNLWCRSMKVAVNARYTVFYDTDRGTVRWRHTGDPTPGNSPRPHSKLRPVSLRDPFYRSKKGPANTFNKYAFQ